MIRKDERSDLFKLVDEAVARWRDGETPDAASFLEQHPEIGSRRTLALDLIHEELCLRKEAGDTVVPSTFTERFPEYRRSIAKMIEVEQFGDSHPEFAAAVEQGLWPEVGGEFMGFEILELIGRGALAHVYLARELDMGRRPVVIKVSRHGSREAHLLGRLEHPNIVTAHSVKQDEATGMTVICMPLLGTATLVNLLDAAFKNGAPPKSAEVLGLAARQYQPAGLVKPESLKDAWPFARHTYIEGVIWLAHEMAAGLAAAHEVGVLHRDIKPSNVLLDWSGRPMLLDFNLSSDLDERADRIGGTLAYMAPERIAALLAGKAASESLLDPRSDLFSLGAVLYELITGRLPCQPADAEGNDDAAMQRWLEARGESIPPMSEANPAVPADFEHLIQRLLDVDPDRRPRSAGDLVAEVRPLLARTEGARAWLIQNRRAVVFGGLAAAATIATVTLSVSLLPSAHDRHFARGLTLYNKGEYEKALAEFNRAVADEKLSARALFARGQCNYRLKHFNLALQDYQEVLKSEDDVVVWFCVGCAGVQVTDLSTTEALVRAEQKGYDRASVCYQLGKYYTAKSELGKAFSFYSNSINADPENPHAFYERAKTQLNLSRGGKVPILAIEDIIHALEKGHSKEVVRLAEQIHAASPENSAAAQLRAIMDQVSTQPLSERLPEFAEPPLRADLGALK